ncbi:MAG TPA: AmmeMemoRadiSam system protein B [Microvirga sp.]|nr:AmmeMemoRadiSam system protein B [Microvirga sp.]
MKTKSADVASRPPAVAGQFYDADPHRLAGEVERLLSAARAGAGERPKAVIAPHAGYVYSGAAAATAFATLKGSAAGVARVVLIGPAHYVPFRGIAAPTAEAFETPLGTVRLDREALQSATSVPAVTFADAPHAPEHALEVELPFLQVLLPRFTAVPLLVGDAAPEEVAAVLSRLWGGPETLLVISSDLSHFLDYEAARRRDAATADKIERGEWAGIGPADACGHLPIAGFLIEAMRRGLAARRLALCNSGDTAGPRHRVVGYGAWAFHDSAAAPRPSESTA